MNHDRWPGTPRAARFENGGAHSSRPQALAGRGVPHANGRFFNEKWQKKNRPDVHGSGLDMMQQCGNLFTAGVTGRPAFLRPRRVSETRQSGPVGKQPDVPAALPRDFRTLNSAAVLRERPGGCQGGRQSGGETAARPVEANGRRAQSAPDFSFGKPFRAQAASWAALHFCARAGFRKPGGLLRPGNSRASRRQIL